MQLYPLAVGNSWTYKMKDGNTYTNSITGLEGQHYIMLNSASNIASKVYVDGNNYMTNAYTPDQFQPFLKDGAAVNDTWEIHFTANGIQSILVMTVREINSSIEVEGKTYSQVLLLEAESKMNMNGTIMSLNFITKYYYAAGTGLVLTTSSYGDYHGLIDSQLK